MFHDRIYARPSLFYATIIEKIKVEFSNSVSDDLIKSTFEYNIIFFMYVGRITDRYFMEFTCSLARHDNYIGPPILPWSIRCRFFLL